jgi:hypothetical protein
MLSANHVERHVKTIATRSGTVFTDSAFRVESVVSASLTNAICMSSQRFPMLYTRIAYIRKMIPIRTLLAFSRAGFEVPITLLENGSDTANDGNHEQKVNSTDIISAVYKPSDNRLSA